MSKILSKQMAAHAQALMRVATTSPGAQRAEAVRRLDQIGNSPAMRVTFGKAGVIVRGNGDVFSVESEIVDLERARKQIKTELGSKDVPASENPELAAALAEIDAQRLNLEAAEAQGYMNAALRTSLPGSAPLNKKIGGIAIPCGVCVIIGGASAGKTPLAHALASAEVTSYDVARIGEPLAGYVVGHRDAATELAKSMISSPDVVVDSIKDLLAMSSGGTMKSGISRGALTDLSAWSIAAIELGCTLYVPLNPSSPDEEVVKMMVEAAKSNATMTISHAGGQRWDYSVRMGEGLDRRSGTLTFSKDGSLLFGRSVGVSSDPSTREEKVALGSLDHKAYVGISQRSRQL